MAGRNDTRHLILRRRRWYYQRGVPRDLQEAFGARLFCRSLGTGDLTEARRRRDALDREFRAALADLAPDADAWSPEGLIATARHARLENAPEGFRAEAERALTHHPEYPRIETPELVAAVRQAESIADGAGSGAVLLSEAIEEHVEQVAKTARPNSVAARRRALEHLRAHVGDVPVSSITRRQLSQWVGTFPDSESLKTRRNRCGDIVAFMSWAVDVGILANHPAQGLRKLIREDSRGDEAKANGKVRPWSPAEVQTLLAKMRDELPADDPLHALVRMAIYTGARREELAQLRGRDVEVIDGVQVLRIRAGKSANSVRMIPVHSAIRDLVTGVAPDAYILPMDGGETVDGRRSHTTGARFSAFKRQAGFPAELTFHGFRRAAAQRMESGGVARHIAETILGHHRTSLSYGTYSTGADVRVLAEAVESIRYGAESTA